MDFGKYPNCVQANYVQIPKIPISVRLKPEIRKRLAAQLDVTQDQLIEAERNFNGRVCLMQPSDKSKPLEQRLRLDIKTKGVVVSHLFPLFYFVGFKENECTNAT